ncbi:MAG: KH domain-containing protein [Methylococcales bacterium]|nr:KH domain-containing protein [Methylococcales bacterium]
MAKKVVEYIVKSLVDDPEAVSVSESRMSDELTIEISVAAEDTGRVIGRGGRVINAIRAVVQNVADRNGEVISLEVQ